MGMDIPRSARGLSPPGLLRLAGFIRAQAEGGPGGVDGDQGDPLEIGSLERIPALIPGEIGLDLGGAFWKAHPKQALRVEGLKEGWEKGFHLGFAGDEGLDPIEPAVQHFRQARAFGEGY